MILQDLWYGFKNLFTNSKSMNDRPIKLMRARMYFPTDLSGIKPLYYTFLIVSLFLAIMVTNPISGLLMWFLTFCAGYWNRTKFDLEEQNRLNKEAGEDLMK